MSELVGKFSLGTGLENYYFIVMFKSREELDQNNEINSKEKTAFNVLQQTKP